MSLVCRTISPIAQDGKWHLPTLRAFSIRKHRLHALFLSVACLVPACLPAMSKADGLPQMRLETKGHTDRVRGLLFIDGPVDGDKQQLLSAGWDQSVRLWSLKANVSLDADDDTQAMQTYRYFSDGSDMGQITCTAYDRTANHHYIALGRSGRDKQDNADILITTPDLQGKLLRTLQGCKQRISALAFSPRGDYLAACDVHGHIVIYETAGWTKMVVPKTSEDSHFQGIAWSPDAANPRLAAAGANDRVLVWDAKTWKSPKELPVKGGEPDGRGDLLCLAWAGKAIAAGDNKGHVLLWQDEKQAHNLFKDNKLPVNCLAFDKSGDTLVVGLDGTESVYGQVWQCSVAKEEKSILSDGNIPPVTAVAISPEDNQIAAACATGDVLLWAGNSDRSRRLGGSGHPAFDVFWSDKNTVAWGWKRGGIPTAAFSLKEMVSVAPRKREDAVNAGNRLKIEGEDHDSLVLYNDKNKPVKSIQLGENATGDEFSKDTSAASREKFQACALDSANNQAYAAISSRVIRQYDLAKKDMGAPARRLGGYSGTILSMSVSPDGQYLAAGSSDQRVRLWYIGRPPVDASVSQAPLICLFVGSNKDWIAWNEQTGYYAASVNGDSIIKWQFNRAVSELAEMRSSYLGSKTFCKPERMKEIYNSGVYPADTKTLQEQLANAPAVTDVSVVGMPKPTGDRYHTNERQVTLHVDVAKPGEPGLEYHVYVTRKGARAVRRFETFVAPDKNEIKVSLMHGENHVQVFVSNAYVSGNIYDKDVFIDCQAPAEEEKLGKLYVVSVGISDYDEQILKLKYAAKDAEDMARVFDTPENRKLFSEVEIVPLIDAKATQENIIAALKKLRDDEQMTENDTLVFFVAGHGFTVNNSGGKNANSQDFYFAPIHFQMNNMAETGVSWLNMLNILTQIKAKNKILLIDHCFAGGVNKLIKDADTVYTDHNVAVSTDVVRRLQQNSILTLAAASENEESWEDEAWKHGAFTFALLKALRGEEKEAKTEEERVTLDTLSHYVYNEVRQLVWSRKHAKQYPRVPTIVESREIPLASVK